MTQKTTPDDVGASSGEENGKVKIRDPQYPTSHLTAAHWWANQGAAVLPLAPQGKTPISAHGKDDATTDATQITQWWTTTPDANIGVRPGNGLIVVDIDPRNGGEDTFLDLTDGHPLDSTLIVRTGSGGWHFWYRLPFHAPIRGTAGPGIDLKANTGYLVCPPSIHPCGDRYEFFSSPEQSIAPLPPCLHRHVYRQPTKRTGRTHLPTGDQSTAGLIRAVAEAQEGSRNQVLYWAACRSVENGHDLTAQLTDAAHHAGLDDLEIKRTLRSAAGKDAA